MRLTAFTDYGLRVLLHVAAAPGRRSTIAAAAQACGASQHHIVKVVHALGKLGYLENTRGRGGGLRLGAPAAEINVGRLVRAIERTGLVECFDPQTSTCPLTGGCTLGLALHEAIEAFHACLDRYTLADLVRPSAARPAPIHSIPGRATSAA